MVVIVFINGLSWQIIYKIGRAGVPLEVMGLMLGEFEDEYSVQVVDVFAMPQLGTGVSVEAVDPVFQVCRHKTCVCVPCDCFTLYTTHLLCCLIEKDDGHAHSDWPVSLFFSCSSH